MVIFFWDKFQLFGMADEPSETWPPCATYSSTSQSSLQSSHTELHDLSYLMFRSFPSICLDQ